MISKEFVGKQDWNSDFLTDYLSKSSFICSRIIDLNLYDIYNFNRNFLNEIMYKDLIENFNHYGVTEKALNKSQELNLNLLGIFCTPNRLLLYPDSIIYFRSISNLPKKSIKSFGLKDITSFENKSKQLSSKEALEYTKIFNFFISKIIELNNNINSTLFMQLFFLNNGNLIDGMWRNEKGAISEKVFIDFLLDYLYSKNEINGYITKNDKVVEESNIIKSSQFHGKGRLFKGIRLKSGRKILFSSEPDVSIYDIQNNLIFTIEIKGGLDKAGALERYGATKKSFAKIKQNYPNCKSIFLYNTITTEVLERIKEDLLFDYSFSLVSLVSSNSEQSEFFNIIFQ